MRRSSVFVVGHGHCHRRGHVYGDGDDGGVFCPAIGLDSDLYLGLGLGPGPGPDRGDDDRGTNYGCGCESGGGMASGNGNVTVREIVSVIAFDCLSFRAKLQSIPVYSEKNANFNLFVDLTRSTRKMELHVELN